MIFDHDRINDLVNDAKSDLQFARENTDLLTADCLNVEGHEKRVANLERIADYERRVLQLVWDGLSRSDAQAVVDAEDLKKSRKEKDNVEL